MTREDTPRIALITTECAQLSDAVTQIIERHRGRIALVITGDPFGTRRGGLVRQTIRNFRRSGLRFVKYLMYSFTVYPIYLHIDRLTSWMRRGRRTRYRAAELCRRYGIEHLCTPDINGTASKRAIRNADVDFIVVYWFDQILHDEVISLPREAVINVHAAYLPQCRGLFPILFSALEPNTPFGITAHLIENKEIDAGKILLRRTTDPPPGRSILFYDSWVNRVGVDLLDELLRDVRSYLARARPQAGGSYHSYPSRAEMAVAQRAGLRLSSLRDFFAVVRGTGGPANDHSMTPRVPATRESSNEE